MVGVFAAVTQTDEFLGRKLAKRLKAASNDNGNTGSAAEAAATDEGGEDGAGEILGRERRKAEAEPVDLEVIDDRDLYQHLLKVRRSKENTHVVSLISTAALSASVY